GSTIVGAAAAAVAVGAEATVLFLGVPFGRVAILVTVAFGGILLWMAGFSVAGLIGGILPAGLGWLGVATVAVAIVLMGSMARDPAVMRGDRIPNRGEMTVGAIPFLAIFAWLVWLGLAL
ncbi:MAG: hypothetical protein GWN58_08160, partial [Anaerolineae bacterium]|nr:hypothetical protein [Anaerolineae bacterium]